MTKREQELEAEVAVLRAEVGALKEQVAQLLGANAELQAQLSKFQSEPPSFIKPNSAKSKDKAQKQPRCKRAKEQNGARRREVSPT